MEQRSAMDLLKHMFEVELDFLQRENADLKMLATAFHPDVVVHEPKSLPYAGDWNGLAGVGALFRKMREVWRDLKVERLEATREGGTVIMTCTLHLTSRETGANITQPFAEVLRFEDDRLIEGTPFYYDTAEIVAAIGKT